MTTNIDPEAMRMIANLEAVCKLASSNFPDNTDILVLCPGEKAKVSLRIQPWRLSLVLAFVKEQMAKLDLRVKHNEEK